MEELAKIRTGLSNTVFDRSLGPLSTVKSPKKIRHSNSRKSAKTKKNEVTCKLFSIVLPKFEFSNFFSKRQFFLIFNTPKYRKQALHVKKTFFTDEIFIFKVEICWKNWPPRKQILSLYRHIESPYKQICAKSGLKTYLDYPEDFISSMC